ncbi:hypothetical protein H4R24_003834 [Coemansia sp. RSA 988]|nr:hypothetical protein H4R24_003834 [Coemansia sp. RSA 988]
MSEPLVAKTEVEAAAIIDIVVQSMVRLHKLDYDIDQAYADDSDTMVLNPMLEKFIPGIMSWTQKVSGSSA